MDLKDFQNVGDKIDEAKTVVKKVTKAKPVLVDEKFHDESDQIIKDLEARIAALNDEGKKKGHEVENHDISEGEHVEEEHENVDEGQNTYNSSEEEIEKVYMQESGDTFLDKIKPFILPICLTIFALIFAAIFMYFFSKSRVEKSVQAIVNNQSQPEVIIVKENKPEVEKKVVIIPEIVVPECDPDTQVLNEELNECEDLPPPPPPAKAGFENGITTQVKVRFAYDKFNYDNYPRGIYLLSDQIFEGEYEDYKLLTSNRPYANDMFFGVDRYMVSLLGACQYVIDEATIEVSDMKDSEGDQVYSAIKDKYFRGKMTKILESSKPHVVCGK